MAVGSFVLALAVRFLVGVLGRSFGMLLGIAAFACWTGLPLFAYLFLLYAAVDFLAPGALHEALEEQGDLERWQTLHTDYAAEKERRIQEEKLDARERAFNAAAGRGPFTDQEAFIQGKESADEYAASDFLRVEKLNK